MKKQKTVNSTTYHYYPPVVTILGHVDHGKTTLLDTIRKTNVAISEAGGITQRIGAYQVTVPPKGQAVTFIDTPGHEAFSKMRSRGANVADIAVLVVAANDGVMPQTLESISHILSSKIPCIVAINKIDLGNVNLEKIKKQLTKAGLKLEEYGGEVPVIPLSAKKGTGIEKLLEMILLINELYQKKEEKNKSFEAVVIEASLSKNRGPVATVIVKHGLFKVGDLVNCLDQEFKVRAILDWWGKNREQAEIGQPAEVLGWKKVPTVGSIVVKDKQIKTIPIQQTPPPTSAKKTVDVMLQPKPEDSKIKLIIKADSVGSLEALTHGIKDDVEILQSSTGLITESDVLLAKTTKAIIVGFNVETPAHVLKLAQSEKVFIKNFKIIYEVFQEISEVVEALKKGGLVTILGEAKIIATFDVKGDKVAGVEVVSGRLARGDQVKIMQEGEEIGRTRIKSLRHLKEDITRVEQGTQAGVIFATKVDFLTGGSIISIG